jgi:hypothetical protein
MLKLNRIEEGIAYYEIFLKFYFLARHPTREDQEATFPIMKTFFQEIHSYIAIKWSYFLYYEEISYCKDTFTFL